MRGPYAQAAPSGPSCPDCQFMSQLYGGDMRQRHRRYNPETSSTTISADDCGCRASASLCPAYIESAFDVAGRTGWGTTPRRSQPPPSHGGDTRRESMWWWRRVVRLAGTCGNGTPSFFCAADRVKYQPVGVPEPPLRLEWTS
jgi:hypothetical protein